MDRAMSTESSPKLLERAIVQGIFTSRWILAPFYAGLVISLLVLLVKFVQKTVKLAINALTSGNNDVITDVLSLIDVSLVASLVLMVMFAGFENFVSRFNVGDSSLKPSWMGHVDFGDLKLKLLTSIVAITAIHVLEGFMEIGAWSDRELGWSVGILLAFVVTGVLLGLMNRLSGSGRH